jgi:hypothetical protein
MNCDSFKSDISVLDCVGIPLAVEFVKRRPILGGDLNKNYDSDYATEI